MRCRGLSKRLVTDRQLTRRRRPGQRRDAADGVVTPFDLAGERLRAVTSKGRGILVTPRHQGPWIGLLRELDFLGHPDGHGGKRRDPGAD